MPAPFHAFPHGPARPFQIGLRPLDPAEWIDADGLLDAYLTEKQRLFTTVLPLVFAAEPETEAAQAEILDLLLTHLPTRFPDLYRRDGDTMSVEPTGRTVQLSGGPPLLAAASLVQDDLVLMRRGETGWRLAAAALCFPSAWRLADKFGQPMHAVHGPVPGFAAGTRNALLIERMFDHLRPETPVLRWNWSLFGDDRLHHPEGGHPDARFGTDVRSVFLRLERQTLRRLPQSGDIVFAIRIYVDPLAALSRLAEGRAIAATMATQLAELSPEQADYKGLLTDRALLLRQLRDIAG